MKKHNILKVVCIAILLAVILTWIIPGSYFSGSEIVDQGMGQLGLFDLFDYITGILVNWGYIPLFILAIGGFYGVLYKTSGYRNLLDKIVEKYKGSEWIFLTLVMIIFAVVTSVAGLYLGLLFLFPFVITVILLMGYSKVTALLTTVGSICVGLIAPTYSAIDLSYTHQALSLEMNAGLVTRIIILVVCLILLVVNTLVYAKKHKIDSPRKGFLYPESKSKKAKAWPVALVLDIVFIIMILSFISWSDMFEVDIFNKALEAIQDFKLFKFPVFAKVLGGVSAFGAWQISDFLVLIVLATGFVALLSRVKFDEMLDGFGAGAKRALRPALVTSLVYFFLMISYYQSLPLTIIKPILGLTEGFNVITTSLAAIVSHLFHVEIAYSTSWILPYVVSTVSDATTYNVIAILWHAMYGFVMLFVPTSAVLVAGLSYLNVSYFKWLKAIWKLLLQLLVVLLVIFLIVLAI